MPCSNASGLLVIGKAKNPRAFKNVNLPVVYKNQSRAWMTKAVFTEWFHEQFVSSVKTLLKKLNLPQKALLLFDNCPGHPDEEDLKSENDFIRVMFLPPNVTPLIQPMDQNVIQTVKMHYKKSLLYKILSKDSDENIVKVLKETNLRDIVFSLANSWECLTKKTIICSWGNLWPDMELLKMYRPTNISTEVQQTEKRSREIEEITELPELKKTILETLSTSENITPDEFSEWIFENVEENYQLMTDDEIIDEVAGEEEEEMVEEPTAALITVGHDCAMEAFNTDIKWAEENCVPASELLVLKRVKDKVLKSSFKAKKQKKIDSFFTPCSQ